MQQHYQTGAKIALIMMALGCALYAGAWFSAAAAVQENADDYNSFFGGQYEPAGPMITHILTGLLFLGMAAVFALNATNPSWNLLTPALIFAGVILMGAAGILANQAAFDGADIEPKFWIVGMLAGAIIAAGLLLRNGMTPVILGVGAILLFTHVGILDSNNGMAAAWVASYVFAGIAALLYGTSFLAANKYKTYTTGAAVGAFIMALMLRGSASLDDKPFKNLEFAEGATKAGLILDGIGSIFIVVATAGVLLAVCIWGLLKFDAVNQPANEES